ncbi:MAG: creatininase family protein [Acidilobaceae archaeon]|nr:creatininase family protein [Acidilobaceae archaeon]MCX8165200.1 creatininase family protein [Acidilobaceae archaeon]MDW7974284.1 creatininase family protein [Sulfolobales archaeon]
MPLEYARLSSRELERVAEVSVAVLPLGSMEQHCEGPLGFDSFVAEKLAWRACEELERRGKLCVLLPTLYYGFSPEWSEVRGTVSLDLRTYSSLISSVLEALLKAGFKRIALLNAHGGNAGLLEAIARELSREGAVIGVINYWQALGISLDHAGPGEAEVAKTLGLEVSFGRCEEEVSYTRPSIVAGRVRRTAGMRGRAQEVGNMAERVAEAIERLFEVRGTLI